MEKIKNTLANLNINLDTIADENIKTAIMMLFNIIEDVSSENNQLREQVQRLRDEISILKGEQPKPKIKPKNKDDDNGSDISSEQERNNNGNKKDTPGVLNKKRSRQSKKDKIKVDRQEICKVDTSQLPDDAQFKGYESVVVQDLKITTDNIEFKKEIYYSPGLNKTYRGNLPPGYTGEFGPRVKSLAVIMKYVCNTSESKILEFFKNFNIHVSTGWISNTLTQQHNTNVFHQEKDDIYEAGLKSSNHQQTDDTGARVNGENQYSHIMCNDLYTAYFTTKRKDRLTILDILRNFKRRKYCINNHTLELLTLMRVSKKTRDIINQIKQAYPNQEYTSKQVKEIFKKYFPNIGKIQKASTLEAMAISYYRQQTRHPVIHTLVCDDAPQFKLLTQELGLCWVHDGRWYKKLRPIVPHHVEATQKFLNTYWDYYHQLLEYKKTPQTVRAQELSQKFDEIFQTQTGYTDLDDRIAKTQAKKKELLLVLKYSKIPLHNNQAELGARAQVRRRDVSLHTISKEGTRANDTFLTIVQTAKKLGVNVYDYVFDRVSQRYTLPPLAEVITRRATMEY